MRVHVAAPGESWWRALVRTIPNALTVVRLVLGLAFLMMPRSWQVPVLLIATATEFLDGWLARWLRATSATGQVLDPIADKIFVLAVLLSLLRDGVLTPGAALFVAARDIAVATGTATVGLCRGTSSVLQMRPRILGKLATTAQLLLLIVGTLDGAVPAWLLLGTGLLSVAAGLDYVRQFF